MIPNELLSYPGLSSSAKLLWARLAQYAGKDGRAYPSIATLAESVNLKERQVQNLLAELKKKGFIESSKGPRSNSYFFLLHPCLVDGLMQNNAPADAKKCLPGTQKIAPKETNKENQRRETTTKKTSRSVSFSNLSEEDQRYIELKVAFEASRDNIHNSAAALRAGLVKKAVEGKLDLSGLKELEAWKKNQGRSVLSPEVMIRSADKEEMRKATIERVQGHVQEDERSPKELCDLIKEQGKASLPKGVWGLSYQSVAMGLKELHPEYW